MLLAISLAMEHVEHHDQGRDCSERDIDEQTRNQFQSTDVCAIASAVQ